jgi:outer membrane protein insertion porin family
LILALLLSQLLLLLLPVPGLAASIRDLRPGEAYRVDRLEISGNKAVSASEILAQLKTQSRPFYQVWKERPLFNPGVFEADLERVKRLYQVNGFYAAKIAYDLKLQKHLVSIEIRPTEGPPVLVQKVDLKVDGQKVRSGTAPYSQLTVKSGQIFTQDAYQNSERNLRKYFLDRGYAHVKLERQALVNLKVHRARLQYAVWPGVRAVFGESIVKHADNVDPALVLRELEYRPGDLFSQEKIEESRQRIVKLGIFALVRFNPQLHGPDSRVVPIEISLKPRPKHSVRAGGGYNTESQFVAHVQWSDNNWVGGGRQFSLLAQYSNINSMLVASLVQPYLFGLRSFRAVIDVREDIQQVPTYTLFASRILPHLDYSFTPQFTGYLGFRAEYAKLTSIDPTVSNALGPIRQSGLLFGPYAGIILNTADDPFNPRSGYIVAADIMEGGGIFGGDYNFYRLEAEIKRYQLIGWGTILAMRFRVGSGDSLREKDEYPLFYRFYAGGEGSVRGYAYWRLGPKSSDNVPLGGLSDLEGSFELRHRLWEKLWGAAFLDYGQLSLHPYDLPISNIRLAAGPALSYATPVGPVRIDLGFPFKKPRGEANWQVYFSIGQFF